MTADLQKGFDDYPRRSITGPIRNPIRIDKSDENDLPFACRAIMVGTVGDVKITDLDGDDCVLPNLAAGVWHPQFARKIWSTGTEPSEICIGR